MSLNGFLQKNEVVIGFLLFDLFGLYGQKILFWRHFDEKSLQLIKVKLIFIQNRICANIFWPKFKGQGHETPCIYEGWPSRPNFFCCFLTNRTWRFLKWHWFFIVMVPWWFIFYQFLVLYIEKNPFLKFFYYVPEFLGFQTRVILDL